MLSFLLFSSVAMAQSPQLTTVSPVMITAYGPASTLEALGSQLATGCVVYWNWSPRATTYVSPTELKAEILASDIATPTTGYVTVEDMVTVTMTTGVEVPVTGGVPKLLFTKMYAPWNDTPGEIGSPGFLVNFNLASTPGGLRGGGGGNSCLGKLRQCQFRWRGTIRSASRVHHRRSRLGECGLAWADCAAKVHQRRRYPTEHVSPCKRGRAITRASNGDWRHRPQRDSRCH